MQTLDTSPESEDDKRWQVLRDFYAGHTYKTTPISELARTTGLRWFESRSGDTPEQFIQYAWHELIRLRGFGEKKIELLVKILAAHVVVGQTLHALPSNHPKEEPPPLEIPRWNSFPLELSFCTARTKALFEKVLLKTPQRKPFVEQTFR